MSMKDRLPPSSSLAPPLDLIGNTPLIPLENMGVGRGRLFAKLEGGQPGGSMKDRAALACITSARAEGRLVPGQPVVEMTSGNMGAALAIVCNRLGHDFYAVMSEGNSPERAKMLRVLGAKLILVPQVDGQPGKVTGRDIAAAMDRAHVLTKETGGFLVDQFNNPGVIAAHEEGTGPEIVAGLGMVPDAFVSVVGTGGTFLGVSRYLKSVNNAVVCAVVEPAGAQVLAGRTVTNPAHLLQGAGYAIRPPLWEAALADIFLSVTDDEARACRDELGRMESLYVGYTAAANVCAARKLMQSGTLSQDAVVATILCDTGLKY